MGKSILGKLKRLAGKVLEPFLATGRQTKEELKSLQDKLVVVMERSARIETELAKSLALQQETLKAMAQLQERLIAELEGGLESSVTQIDKKIEKWTWDRHRRTQRLVESGFWNLYYEIQKIDKIPTSYNYNVIYDDWFYFNNRFTSVRSAKRVLSFLLPKLNCESVIDFGCGTGTWLWVALGYGVSEICGIDGEYVPENMLMIPRKCFFAADLSKPYSVTKRYDLALSLEVAEHIPEESADLFIENICKSSDIVLFSAAHPGQGGDGHINEKPVSYWIEKFSKQHYSPIEIKSGFQSDKLIEPWYRENIILFVINDRWEEMRKIFVDK